MLRCVTARHCALAASLSFAVDQLW